jgi:hypothetical protein
MSTSISATLPPQTSSATEGFPDEGTTRSFSSPHRGGGSISETLIGLTASTAQRPNAQIKLITSIERLVDSVARLIEAFTSYRGSSSQQPTTPAKPSTPRSGCGPAPTPNQSWTGTIPSSAPSGSDTKICPPCCQGATDQQPSASTPVNLGSALTKGGGFLWKPVSDKNGDLVVLLPKKLTGKVHEVRVLSPDGKTTLSTGKYSGVGNGNREHFRFSEPGSSYPDGSIVLIQLNDGTTRHIKIKETSKRVER